MAIYSMIHPYATYSVVHKLIKRPTSINYNFIPNQNKQIHLFEIIYLSLKTQKILFFYYEKLC